jgi:hypothetical protein
MIGRFTVSKLCDFDVGAKAFLVFNGNAIEAVVSRVWTRQGVKYISLTQTDGTVVGYKKVGNGWVNTRNKFNPPMLMTVAEYDQHTTAHYVSDASRSPTQHAKGKM